MRDSRTRLVYFMLWFPLIFVAIANAALRQGVLIDRMDELSAHQASTATFICLILLCTYLMMGRFRVASCQEALYIGAMWLLMTVCFEFLFGHFVMGNSWDRLLHDYNILEGRVWTLALLSILLGPALVRRLKGD